MWKTWKLLIVPSVTIGFITPTPSSTQQAQFVYTVRIPATRNHPAAIQTGFRFNGTKGIITALHGVADGAVFSALNDQGDVLNGLRIAYVDIPHDLAILRSPELENRNVDGLSAATSGALAPGQNLRVLGHPLGISLYSKAVQAGSPMYSRLDRFIPPSVAAIFGVRQSPSEDITVLNIEGNLVPGDSGAPILDSSGKIVGVVDGGLLGGAAAISWGIPISQVQWRDANSAQARLQALANLAIQNLFALQLSAGTTDGSIIVAADGTGSYQSIEAAISDVNSGAHLVLRRGVYRIVNTPLIIDKSLTISGEGTVDDAVIQGFIRVAPTGDLRLENLTVHGLGAALIVQGRAVVENSHIDAAWIAVTIEASGILMMRKSTVTPTATNALWGVYLSGSYIGQPQATIDDTDITDWPTDGATVGAGRLVVRGSRIIRNKVGVEISSGGYATIANSDLRGNVTAILLPPTYTAGGEKRGILVEQDNIK